MATTRQRRALTQTRTASKIKPTCSTGKPTATDDALRSITDETSSNKTSKKKASGSRVTELTDEEKRVASMRAVNAASQTLTSIVQSGWKKSSETASGGKSVSRSGNLSKATDAAESASKHLVILRCLSPSDLNVERAAISVSGKLMAVEMYDVAFTTLKDMHVRLCGHLNLSSPSSSPQELVPYLALPLLSPSAAKADPTLLTIISTYLSYSLCMIIGASKGTNFIHSLANFLDSTYPKTDDSGFTLLSWLPSLISLPSKHLDSLISRVYNSLTKFCTTFLSSLVQQRLSSKKTVTSDMLLQNDAYLIRIYALQCLTYSTGEVVAPGAIWEQAMRYGNAYINSIASRSSQDSSEIGNKVARTVLDAHSELVNIVESLPSHERFIKEKSFTTFLEWWMTLARRASDLQALNKISSLMRSTLQSSSTSNEAQSGPSACDSPEASIATDSHAKAGNSATIETLVLRSAHICTVFAQTMTLIDLVGTERSPSAAEEFISQTHQVLDMFSSSKSLQALFIESYSRRSSDLPVDATSDALQKAGDKCDRALERLRKSAIKALEAISPTDYTIQDGRAGLLKLLEANAAFFERVARSHPCTGFFTHTLDTLFALARTTLVANDPRTHDPAYRHLEQAINLLHLDHNSTNDTAGLDTKDFANYVRCLSGTFYNLAGMLYQAGRYGTTIGFLIHGCKLGQNALSMYLSKACKTKNSSSGGALVTSGFQREDDSWHQLEEQMYRRWELLGVCYAKIGDRKNAYTAFVECIKAFPYDACGFAKKAQSLNLSALFESTPALRQLGSIIDRVTYMATAELFLEPEKVSLSHPSLWIDMKKPSDDILGTLLERQICSLESSRWKSNVKSVLIQLLLNASESYHGGATPVRKARVLLRWLEFAYHGGLAEERFHDSQELGTFPEVAEEVENLLTCEELAKDVKLAPFCAQYRASAHLWCALHAHYKGGTDQSTQVAEHADQASSIMKKLLNDITRAIPRKSSSKISQPLPKKSPPKRGGTRKPAAVSGGGSRQRVTRKITIKEPVTPKPKARTVLQALPLNSGSSPKILSEAATDLVIDDFDQFLKLLQTTARVLGLLALILPKVHVLDVTRKICERYAGVTNDGYISASIDLAHEYVKLGKLRRASAVFNHALNSVRSGQVSDDICTLFLLRYAEVLAVLEDIHQSSHVYCEALVSSQRCMVEEKNMSTLQKIQLRVKRLERTAMAAHVFALIQYSRNDVVSAIDGMLQSLRLWNRAADALSRLNPTPSPKEPESEKDVFNMTALKEAIPITESSNQQEKTTTKRTLDSLEWRISEGLLSTLFSLSHIYFFRGSAKEAEYFAQQAHDLSYSLNAPALQSRALAKKGEILLQLGKLEGAHECLAKASEILANIPGIDSADVCRLQGDHSQRAAKHEDAQQMYNETTTMLEELDSAFKLFDGLALGPRKSAGLTPLDKPLKEMVVPELLASVLRQQIWLLRDEGGDEYMALLEKLMALPYSSRTKAEENGLMAQLTLHNVYSRFRNDMFLSSLSESAIALPMCMTSKSKHGISPTSQDLLNILDNAAKLFWANLSLISVNGSVPDVRNATTSLALISAFQTSLGRSGQVESILAATLLDVSSSITLQRELLEAIPSKFFDIKSFDDLEWPLISMEGKPLPKTNKKPTQNRLDASDDEDEDLGVKDLRYYWDSIREKYQSQVHDAKSLTSSLTHKLPPNWTVVHVNITTDKTTLFVSRQRGGTVDLSPLIFCVPIKGRRDNGTGDEDETHLTFEGAHAELQDIIRLSDKGTKAATHINPKDEPARAQWWKERRGLDQRLKDLLENIEFCWLGAFKTVLNPTTNYPSTILDDLRLKLEKLFQQCLGLQDKQNKTRNRKNGSAAEQFVLPSDLTLADDLVECFSTLSPKCRDEELEDLIYFVLDLYQFHGIRVAIAEIDMTQLAVDLRAALEEHVARVRKFDQQQDTAKTPDNKDEHIFLVLGKDLQGIPWESIPVLRGRSVSRIPSLHFLLDRVELVDRQRAASSSPNNPAPFGAYIDPRNGYYVLNPSGDLGRTQDQFTSWVKDMEQIGWHGTIGHPPSEQEFLDALHRQDLVVYFGHGGGEQYVRTHKIRNLTRCAATMLWGCSSGALREMGDFDRTGTPNSYFVAGCPTLVANLWDVTDKDIDKYSQAVFEMLHLSSDQLGKVARQGKQRQELTSVVTAVAQSREVCKLKYLTGAAPVVYGIPFYL